jgi:heparosan-N-sulfate-glucuronate 5-epimerase
MPKLSYYKRIFSAYLSNKNSHLTFWHGQPQANPGALTRSETILGEYYMVFDRKAHYPGPFDEDGIPLLNYHGKIGKQYNPIAIAQYGLGNYNLYKRTKDNIYNEKFIRAADWLLNNIEKNKHDVCVWNHKFEWEYFKTLKAPWYSALAQGQGISLLIRAFIETKKEKYLLIANEAFESLIKEIKDGGVLYIDKNGNWWLEEYLVEPPSHVLNGFIWSLWGVYDYFLVTKEKKASDLYENCLNTLNENLYRYDIGYWSLYDLSMNRLKTIASNFYHNLHIVQLNILHKLTGNKIFLEYSNKWDSYTRKKINVWKATCQKSLFKLFYY